MYGKYEKMCYNANYHRNREAPRGGSRLTGKRGPMERKRIDTDVLIIGGGTAGCFAAMVLGQRPDIRVTIAEKANIRRSGCLAAGVNAINAYITKGHVPQDYVDYARHDAAGIVRGDLLLSMSERLNHVTKVMEDLGLVILKDENGEYVSRGWRNIKINGENIKPLLAEAASAQKNVTILNHVNITDYLTVPADAIDQQADSEFVPSGRKIAGAVGFSVNEPVAYEIYAKAVLVATGGAAGIYRPNNPGFSRHKMWYPPFNTGAGYAMGIRAGAEMTTFEMRFIALRCKDTIAPTGTIAQGVGAKQVNSLGEVYENKYGLTTSERVYGTVEEMRKGRGPCYLKTKGISKDAEESLYRAYLNMAPSQTLKWLEGGQGPSEENVEIQGTEPYIVGGHTASGYWIRNDRSTTIDGLFAAGDVAGGAPQKYVTGALAEGEIAAESILKLLDEGAKSGPQSASVGTADQRAEGPGTGPADAAAEEEALSKEADSLITSYEAQLSNPEFLMTTEEIEEAMQKIMDEYAGGISTAYRYNEASLALADKHIKSLEALVPRLAAANMDDLLRIYEVRERLTVARVLIAHLMARRETRWHAFAENTDFPEKDPHFQAYVNSVYRDGRITTVLRPLIAEDGGNERRVPG